MKPLPCSCDGMYGKLAVAALKLLALRVAALGWFVLIDAGTMEWRWRAVSQLSPKLKLGIDFFDFVPTGELFFFC